MPISLRLPPDKEARVRQLAKRTGRTKTAVICEALDEKLGLTHSREAIIRRMAGWMQPDEVAELREALTPFDRIDEADWP